MASNLLTHLSLASTHRTSIAFFLLIIITLFLVPFLSLSTSSELIPSATALPTLAYTLWLSLLDIFTSSPFYFFLLNFLIVALVFLSGVLDPSSSHRESDGLQEGDLYQRGLYNFSTAAQIIHERLALDELYESQVSSLPYLNITESSRTYVAGDGMIGNGYGDEDEAHNGKGKQVMGDPIDSFLHERPAFSDAGGGDSTEEGCSSGRMDDATEDSFLPVSMVEDDDSDMKKISPISSVVMKSEIAGVCKDIQVYENLHPESDADANADVGANAHREHNKDATADVNNMDSKDGNDVIHDEGGGDHVDEGNVHIDHERNGIGAKTKAEGDGKRRQRRIARTPSEPVIAGKIHSQQEEGNVGAEMGEEEYGRGRSMSLERVPWLGVEKQKEMKAGEEDMMSMSREELNERASAFISAFRKKLVSTAIDDASGHM